MFAKEDDRNVVEIDFLGHYGRVPLPQGYWHDEGRRWLSVDQTAILCAHVMRHDGVSIPHAEVMKLKKRQIHPLQ